MGDTEAILKEEWTDSVCEAEERIKKFSAKSGPLAE